MPERPLDLTDPFDDCEWLPARGLFRKLGFAPLPPAVLDDFQLRFFATEKERAEWALLKGRFSL